MFRVGEGRKIEAEEDGQHQGRLDREVIVGQRGTISGCLGVTQQHRPQLKWEKMRMKKNIMFYTSS